MQTSGRLSQEQIQAFLEGSGEVGFKGQNREDAGLNHQRRYAEPAVRRLIERAEAFAGDYLEKN